MNIDDVFQDCLECFPDITEPVRLETHHCTEVAGAIGRDANNQRIVMLFAPNASMQESPLAFKPILLHELCHLINMENPDEVFEERADETSKKWWHRLRADGQLYCLVEGRAL